MSTSFFCSCLRGGIRHELHKGSRLRHGLSTAAIFATGLESAASQRQYASPRTLKQPPSRHASPLASQRRQYSPRAPQRQNASLWALQRQRTSLRVLLQPPSAAGFAEGFAAAANFATASKANAWSRLPDGVGIWYALGLAPQSTFDPGGRSHWAGRWGRDSGVFPRPVRVLG